MTIPAQRTKQQQFFLWLQWVLLNTFAWVASWVVMKYVLSIHPEHPSSGWFFIIGGLISFIGQWLIIKKIFTDKYSNEFPLQATPEVSKWTESVLNNNFKSISIVLIIYLFSIPGSSFFNFYFYILIFQTISKFIIAQFIKTNTKTIKGKRISSIDTIFVIIGIIVITIGILFGLDVIDLEPLFIWFHNNLNVDLFSASIITFVIFSIFSGVPLTKLYIHLPNDLPKAKPEPRYKLGWRIVFTVGKILLTGFFVFIFIYFQPTIFSPCDLLNSRILGSGCVQSWGGNYDRESVSLSDDGRYLAIVIDSFTPEYTGVEIHEVSSGDLVAELNISDFGDIWAYDIEMKFSPNQKQIAIFIPELRDKNSDLVLWNFVSGEVHSIKFDESYSFYEINLIQFSHDGSYLGIILDEEIHIWEIGEDGFGQEYSFAVEKFADHLNFYKSENKATFISGSTDVYEWDFISGTPPTIISQGHYDSITTTLDARDNFLVAWEEDDSLKLWNGEDTYTLILDNRLIIEKTIFSPNGEYLLAANNGEFWVFRTSDGELIFNQIYKNYLYKKLGFDTRFDDVYISDTGIVLIDTYDELQVWDIFHDNP